MEIEQSVKLTGMTEDIHELPPTEVRTSYGCSRLLNVAPNMAAAACA